MGRNIQGTTIQFELEYQSSMETLVQEHKGLISKQEESGNNLITSIKKRNDKIENIISTTEERCSEIREDFLKDLNNRSKSLEQEISIRLKNYDQTLQESFNLAASDIRKAVRKLLHKELENQRFYWREFIEKNRAILDRFKVLDQSLKVLATNQKKRNNSIMTWLIVIGSLSFCNIVLFLSSSSTFDYLATLGQRIVEFICIGDVLGIHS